MSHPVAFDSTTRWLDRLAAAHAQRDLRKLNRYRVHSDCSSPPTRRRSLSVTTARRILTTPKTSGARPPRLAEPAANGLTDRGHAAASTLWEQIEHGVLPRLKVLLGLMGYEPRHLPILQVGTFRFATNVDDCSSSFVPTGEPSPLGAHLQ